MKLSIVKVTGLFMAGMILTGCGGTALEERADLQTAAQEQEALIAAEKSALEVVNLKSVNIYQETKLPQGGK